MKGVDTKLAVTGVTGAVVGIILWALNTFAHVAVPDEVAAWIAILVGVIAGLFTSDRLNGKAKA